MQSGGFDLSIQFSHLTSSWTWTCVFGCYGWDHEGEQEAREAFLMHTCTVTVPIGVTGSEPCS